MNVEYFHPNGRSPFSAPEDAPRDDIAFLAGPGDRERLWLGTFRPGGRALITGINRTAVQRWAQRHDVTSDDGEPLKVHRSRIRTTHLSLRDKSAWAGRGRATIDPNHSPEVEGDHYLTAATPAQQQAVEAIVAAAQHDDAGAVHVSALTGEGLDALLTRLDALLQADPLCRVRLRIPQKEGKALATLEAGGVFYGGVFVCPSFFVWVFPTHQHSLLVVVFVFFPPLPLRPNTGAAGGFFCAVG